MNDTTAQQIEDVLKDPRIPPEQKVAVQNAIGALIGSVGMDSVLPHVYRIAYLRVLEAFHENFPKGGVSLRFEMIMANLQELLNKLQQEPSKARKREGKRSLSQ
jgi:hypothetical protein